jgi:hypothetical protein
MDITQESVSEFFVGHGGADIVSKPIVAANYACKAYKGIRVRAKTTNTIVIHLGPQGVSEVTGYPLPAGEEVTLPIDNPSKVHVIATPVGNSQQVVTLTDAEAGDTFTLTFEGETTTDISYDANATVVDSALEALSTIGTGHINVSGNAGGPWTVEFIGSFAKKDVSPLIGNGTGCTVAITKTDASSGSQYSWLSV